MKVTRTFSIDHEVIQAFKEKHDNMSQRVEELMKRDIEEK